MVKKTPKKSKTKEKMPKLNKNFFQVENMDTLAREDKINDKNNQIHELLPRHPARILICGASGTGKSNLMINMLYKPMLVFEKLYVYSAMFDQPKYKFLKNHYQLLDEMVKKECGLDQKTIMKWQDNLENIDKLIDELDPEFKNLIVIDDFSVCPTKQEQQAIDILYTKCRHKNTSIMILGQMYFKNPSSRCVRNNLTHLILYQNYNSMEIQLLQKEVGSDLPKGHFRRLYNYILSKKYDFLYIDNTTDNKRKRYRRNFDGLYGGPLNNYKTEFFMPDDWKEDEDEDEVTDE